MYPNAKKKQKHSKHTTFDNIFRRPWKKEDYYYRPPVLAVKAVCQDMFALTVSVKG